MTAGNAEITGMVLTQGTGIRNRGEDLLREIGRGYYRMNAFRPA